MVSPDPDEPRVEIDLILVNDTARKENCLNQQALICNVQEINGSHVNGTVRFTPKWNDYGCYVEFSAKISGLDPNAEQAIHIHSYGDLTKMEGDSVGGHYQGPYDTSEEEEKEWYDRGVLHTDSEGRASTNATEYIISLQGILGRGGEDKKARVAFCVIGFANPHVQLRTSSILSS